MQVNGKRAYVLGLTGGIGCGKSEAAAWLKSLGAVHVDADAISRSLTAENGAALPAIREVFGDDVFHADGTLDRAALGARVFRSEADRRALEEILHPRIRAEEECRIRAAEGIVVLDVPLLFETGTDALCDSVWVVQVPFEEQLRRVMERGLTEEQARERIASQMSSEARAARADTVIRTDRPLEETRAALTRLWNELKETIENGKA